MAKKKNNKLSLDSSKLIFIGISIFVLIVVAFLIFEYINI